MLADESHEHGESGIPQRYGAINPTPSACIDFVVYFMGTYPDSISALANTVMGFLVNDSYRDLALQEREGSNEPGWSSTDLVHNEYRSVSSIASWGEGTHDKYRSKRSSHDSAIKR